MIPVLATLLGAGLVAAVLADRRTPPTPDVATCTPAAALALARVEGGRLLRHPLVWVGAAAAPLLLEFASGQDWQVRAGLTGFYLSALAVAGFVVVHLAVSRDRRAGTEELAVSLPLGPRTRVPAHLASLLWLMVPATTGWTVLVWWRLGPAGTLHIHAGRASYVWQPPLAELAQGPFMLLVALLIAVAVGVWWGHPAVGVVLALLLFVSPVIWMVPLTIDVGPIAPHLQNRVVHVDGVYLAWHYLFTVGLAVLAVATALLRHGSRLRWGVLAGLAGAALWAGFVLQRHEWWFQL